MAIYIYRSGGSPNPGPQNPLVRFLLSAAVLAGVIGLGVLLLPVFGFIVLIVLGLIVLLIGGALIYRCFYGDPLANAMKKAQEQAQGMRVNPEFKSSASNAPPKPRAWQQRQAEIEDAVVVEEKTRQ